MWVDRAVLRRAMSRLLHSSGSELTRIEVWLYQIITSDISHYVGAWTCASRRNDLYAVWPWRRGELLTDVTNTWRLARQTASGSATATPSPATTGSAICPAKTPSVRQALPTLRQAKTSTIPAGTRWIKSSFESLTRLFNLFSRNILYSLSMTSAPSRWSECMKLSQLFVPPAGTMGKKTGTHSRHSK